MRKYYAPKPLNLYVFLICILLFVSACSDNPKNTIRIIAFKGSEISTSKFFLNSFQANDTSQFINVPVQNGDLIGIENSFFMRVRKDFPDSLVIRNEDSLLFVNGDLLSLSLTAFFSFQDFIKNSGRYNLTELQNLVVKVPLEDDHKFFLEKISKVKPRIDLFITNNDTLGLFNQDLRWLSDYFEPELLLVDIMPANLDFGIIENMNSLEFLGLGDIPVSVTHQILPPLPQIRSFLLNYNGSNHLNIDFFTNNSQIEQLIAMYPVSDEIYSLKRLKELTTFYSLETSSLYEFSVRNPNLENMNFDFYNPDAISKIKGLKKLQWLSVNFEGDSLGFDLGELASIQPNIRLLYLKQRVILNNYEALKNFPKLDYLLIEGEIFGMDSVILQMPNLKYLSLPEEYLKDTAQIERLQKALPKTIIAPNSGVCLGSGWILILIPFSILAFYFQYFFQKTSKN